MDNFVDTRRMSSTCRPSGLWCLVHAACYKHVAPLGLNTSTQQNSRHGIHRRGEVSSPDGLGNPTPTHPIWLRVFNPVHPLILSILIQTNRTCRSAGAAVSCRVNPCGYPLSLSYDLLVRPAGNEKRIDKSMKP